MGCTALYLIFLLMKKLVYFLCLSFVMAACNGGNKEQELAHQQYQDSIEAVNAELTQFIQIVANELDSINLGPLKVLGINNNEGAPLPTREQILQNIEAYQQTVAQQRQRIAELEKSLENATSENAKQMKTIIASLKSQIAEKDKEIAELHTQLLQKDVNISMLQSNIASLQTNVEGLEEQARANEKTIVEQSDELNVAYVRIGSKKDLQEAGVLSKGNLLKKSKIQLSDFDPSKFTKVDKRTYQSVKFAGEDAKVLTPMPEGSYRIEQESSATSILYITDPNSFWSVSPYLVIQVK